MRDEFSYFFYGVVYCAGVVCCALREVTLSLRSQSADWLWQSVSIVPAKRVRRIMRLWRISAAR
jgi:hypothetical protein